MNQVSASATPSTTSPEEIGEQIAARARHQTLMALRQRKNRLLGGVSHRAIFRVMAAHAAAGQAAERKLQAFAAENGFAGTIAVPA